jgi:hypothetical protein
LARGFRWERSRSPYPGIFSFEREDAAIFFGRDEETRDVIERLEARRVQGGKRFLCILGASGGGKSSLLKAGVLPQLERTGFLELLHAAVASDEALPYLVVATARSDALEDILRSRQFSVPFENYVLRPMPLDRLPKVIEGPAATAAVTVEKGLCERITQDTKSAEALPLLAFTLRELYERMGRQRHALNPPGCGFRKADEWLCDFSGLKLACNDLSADQLSMAPQRRMPNGISLLACRRP